MYHKLGAEFATTDESNRPVGETFLAERNEDIQGAILAKLIEEIGEERVTSEWLLGEPGKSFGTFVTILQKADVPEDLKLRTRQIRDAFLHGEMNADTFTREVCQYQPDDIERTLH